MKIRSTVPWVVGALVAGLALAGCGGPTPPPRAPVKPRPSVKPSPTPSPSPSPTPALTKAADGTNYGSCASRSCEVAVSGPVDISFGGSAPGSLSITKVVPGTVTFDLTLDNGGGGNGTLKPGCTTAAFGGGGGGFGSFGGPAESCAQMPAGEPGAAKLQMPAMNGGTAIIRIAIA